MKQYLSYIAENYTSGEITFGFEFEAICRNKKSVFERFKKYTTDFWGGGNFVDDMSVRDRSAGESYPFEFAGPVLRFTPLNIQKLIKFFSNSLKESFGVITNESCGFHIHFGVPFISNAETSIDNIWTVLQIGFGLIRVDGEEMSMIDFLKEFDGIKFFNDEFASYSYLTKLKTKVMAETNKEKIFAEMEKALLDESRENIKMRIFRLHPQGTLEWRGPRDFMNGGDYANFKNFLFNRLIPFVSTFIRIQNLQELELPNGIIITKNELRQWFDKYNSKEHKNFPYAQISNIDKTIFTVLPFLNKDMVDIQTKQSKIYVRNGYIVLKDINITTNDDEDFPLDNQYTITEKVVFSGCEFMNLCKAKLNFNNAKGSSSTFYAQSRSYVSFNNSTFADSHFDGAIVINGGTYTECIFDDEIIFDLENDIQLIRCQLPDKPKVKNGKSRDIIDRNQE